MASRHAGTVPRVYLASKIPNMGDLLRSALKSIDGKSVSAVELQLMPSGNDLSQESTEKIKDIQYLFADPGFIGQVLSHPESKLIWAQSTFAGVEPIFKALEKKEMPRDVLVSRQTDGFGQFIAEYVIGEIIARERKFPLMYELQKKASFKQDFVSKYRGLDEMTLGILGLGNIGTEVARQCKALNMTIWAAVRDDHFKHGEPKCEHVHYFRPMSRLSDMFQEVDYLVNILPSTPQTRGLLNGDTLKPCEKKKTVFINVGRGDVIDDNSLIHSLKSGWLGGAILDVFNTEPLPSESPLWTMPGVTITPHVAATSEVSKCVNAYVNNLKLYLNGQPVLNQVDLQKGY